MKKFTLFIFIICLLLGDIFCAKKKKKVKELDENNFCYSKPKCGPKKWGGLCNAGTRQSPINFDGEKMGIKILPPSYRQFYSFSPASDTQMFIIRNTGHTIQVEFPRGKEPILRGLTFGLPGSYRFERLNFHWGRFDKDGSEHRIGGKGFAMELQIIHYSTQYSSYAQASQTQTDPFAVKIISILYEIGPIDNLALKPITDAISLVRKYAKGGEEVTVNRYINMKAFFPAFLSFYRYEGSLTIPSCLENRVWSVFKKPSKISKRQLEEFRSIFTMDNIHLMIDNHRPLQSRNGRAVTLYFTPSNIYDWMMQFGIYIYTFVRQLMAMPKDIVQSQLKTILKPFVAIANLQI